MQKLTPETVQNIFFDCLFTKEEVKDLAPGQSPPGAVLVRGVTVSVGMHQDRLNKHKEEIKELLSQLPDAFYSNKGGGMSLLNLPFLNDETTQWGEHKSAEQLMLMGIASKLMKYCAPKEMWAALPGGVPYVVINLDGF